jgi:DNA repair exonuclease SbcCD ATPase subunit
MLIENIMYFALGLLVAGLVALVIMPAVWKRAVRLTTRRIEAATPITMAEFRADKDQLRAEFALSTRRLEMNVEALRKRLAEQLSDVNQKRTDLGALKAERANHLQVVGELESRETELRARILELEKEATDLAQRLRMRERELETRNSEIEALRASSRDSDQPLSSPTAQAETIAVAEAQIAHAEHSLNALLTEADSTGANGGQLLADKLSMDDALGLLQTKVSTVETTILADWQSERFRPDLLRASLGDIAASVSHLIYAEEEEKASTAFPEESLFDRVQRFADDGESEDLLPAPAEGQRGSVSDRLAAVREIQGR